MEKIDASFWMGNRLATECVEISTDPACLNKPGFWAVVNSFEGKWICARFAKVIDAPLPQSDWQPLIGNWDSSLNQQQYEGNVELIKEKIAEGEIYQVNLCRVLTTDCDQSLLGLAGRLQQANPAPYASYLKLPNLEIASASPELFLERNGKQIKSTPIKGTATSSVFGEKDKAENVMIVDLMRNDLGQICKSGSVTVPRLLSTEAHPGLVHLVSDIEGELKDQITWAEIFTRLSPPGSISGAPKSSAVSVIKENEGKRGPYCGALGWVQGDRCELSVAIRIFYKDDKLRFGTGAGITWASVANDEWEETQLKARRLVSLVGGDL